MALETALGVGHPVCAVFIYLYNLFCVVYTYVHVYILYMIYSPGNVGGAGDGAWGGAPSKGTVVYYTTCCASCICIYICIYCMYYTAKETAAALETALGVVRRV